MRPSGTTRKVGPSGGGNETGYLTFQYHPLWWRTPAPFTGSNGARARRNRRRDIRKNGWDRCGNYTDASWSNFDWIEKRRRKLMAAG